MNTTKETKVESGHLVAYISTVVPTEQKQEENKTIVLPTVEEIIAAFKKSGITPVKHRYYSGRCSNGEIFGCLLAALYLVENEYSDDLFYEKIISWGESKYGNLIDYLACGWDDMFPTRHTPSSIEDKAIKIGREAGKAMGVIK